MRNAIDAVLIAFVAVCFVSLMNSSRERADRILEACGGPIVEPEIAEPRQPRGPIQPGPIWPFTGAAP